MVTGLGTAGSRDHDLARKLLQSGRIVPLEAIIARARAEQPGRLLEVELEQTENGFEYEVELLTSDGQVIKLMFDAEHGRLLTREIEEY